MYYIIKLVSALIRGATVQVTRGTVRTSVFGPRFRFSFVMCFVRKENNFFSTKILFILLVSKNCKHASITDVLNDITLFLSS